MGGDIKSHTPDNRKGNLKFIENKRGSFFEPQTKHLQLRILFNRLTVMHEPCFLLVFTLVMVYYSP
jgi:hypothetical protein